MPAGPIATEVVEALKRDPLPVVPAAPVSVQQEPGAIPLETRVTNMATPWSGRWWFEKAGPLGIVCFLLIGSFGWLVQSQSSSQATIFNMMQHDRENASKDRAALMQLILTSQQSILQSQADISNNLARTARVLERIEAKMDKPGKTADN